MSYFDHIGVSELIVNLPVAHLARNVQLLTRNLYKTRSTETEATAIVNLLDLLYKACFRLPCILLTTIDCFLMWLMCKSCIVWRQ